MKVVRVWRTGSDRVGWETAFSACKGRSDDVFHVEHVAEVVRAWRGGRPTG